MGELLKIVYAIEAGLGARGEIKKAGRLSGAKTFPENRASSPRLREIPRAAKAAKTCRSIARGRRKGDTTVSRKSGGDQR